MSKIMLQSISLMLIAAMLANVSGCTNPVATDMLEIETVHEIFPSATDISKMSTSRDVQTSRRPGNHIISEIRDSSDLLGYCVESEVVTRSGPFKIRVFLNQQLVVKQATVISYPWPRGREVVRYAFTSQFDGKGPGDSIRIGKDIDAISGATISCQAMAKGVREAIILLKLMEADQIDEQRMQGN